jgi:hypothetical protein
MTNSARLYARICGFIYVLIFVTGLFGIGYVEGRLIVDGDATATAARIAGAESLWRAGCFAEAFTMICDVAVAWLLYVLLMPVNRNVALLAALFRFAYVPIYGVSVLANYAALPLAQNGLAQATMFALRQHNAAFALSLLFFGTHLFLVGYLIARAPLNVQWLALALEIAGIAYVVNSTTIFVAPQVHAVLFPWILIPPFIGELSLTFWLLLTHRFDAEKEIGRDVSVSPNIQRNLREIT